MATNKANNPASPLIFVVDDDKIMLECTCEILHLLGYNLLATDDPSAALKIYQEHCQEIDLIVTDLHMPGLNGMEMLHSMRGINPALKAIVISGSSELHGRLHDNRFIGRRLSKPFAIDHLANEVSQLLAEEAPAVWHPSCPASGATSSL